MAWLDRTPLPVIEAGFILLLLAIPMSYVNPRMGRSFNLVSAAFMYMVYSNGLNIVQSTIAQGRLSLGAGLVIAHGIAAVVVFLLFRNRIRGAVRPQTHGASSSDAMSPVR